MRRSRMSIAPGGFDPPDSYLLSLYRMNFAIRKKKTAKMRMPRRLIFVSEKLCSGSLKKPMFPSESIRHIYPGMLEYVTCASKKLLSTVVKSIDRGPGSKSILDRSSVYPL